MTNRITQEQGDEHAAMWATRAHVGEVRKPAFSPEADITRDSYQIRAEAVSWDFPGTTVELVEMTGMDANQYGYADKVWIVCNRDETGRNGEAGPIWFNRKHYVIRASRAETDNVAEMSRAYTDWKNRAFGIDVHETA